MMKLPVVRDFMSTSVVALKPEQSMHDALRILLRNKFSGAPVVENGRVIGMISEKDFLKTFTANLYMTLPEGKVRDHMSTTLVTCKPCDELFEVVHIFFDKSLRRLPVVDEDGVLVGIISRSDVVRQCLAIWDDAKPRTDPVMEGLMTRNIRAQLDEKKT